MKQHIVRIALGLALMLVFVGHVAEFYNIGLITRLDNIIYDTRLALTMPGGVDPRIVILDIDERSLDKNALGHWPWRRDKLAALLDQAVRSIRHCHRRLRRGVRRARREFRAAGARKARQRQAQGREPVSVGAQAICDRELDYDGIFAKAIEGTARSCWAITSTSRRTRCSPGAIPAPVLPAGTFKGGTSALPRWRGYGGNLPELQANAANAGHFNPLVDHRRRVAARADAGGIQRRILRGAVAGDGPRPGGLSEGRNPDLHPNDSSSKSYSGLEWLKAGPVTIPVDDTRERVDSLPRQARQFQIYLACRRLFRQRAEGRAAGQDRAGRHLRAGSARSAIHAGGQRLSRGWKFTPT